MTRPGAPEKGRPGRLHMRTRRWVRSSNVKAVDVLPERRVEGAAVDACEACTIARQGSQTRCVRIGREAATGQTPQGLAGYGAQQYRC
jgi:hypothetical protein